MKKRERYLVDKKFQIKMAVRVILLVIVGMLLSGILTYKIAIFREKRSKFHFYGGTDYESEIILVPRQEIVKPIIIESLVISGIAGILIVGLFMIFYTHRIAGPICRLKECMEKVSRGNFEGKLKFRKIDEFKDLAEVFNRMVENIKRRESDNNLSE